MRIIKPALITVLAICLAANGAFASGGKSASRSRHGDSTASSKKKKSSSSRSGRKSSKSRTAKRAAGEHLDGFLEDVPPEDLPAEEESPEE
ncbi:MAG: hypothetical protein ACR2ID_00400 [Chthoniobacterales bacterium]